MPICAFVLPAPRPDLSTLTGPSRYIGVFFGQSQLILGSDDRRIAGSISFGIGRPDPRLRWGRIPGQLVWEFYTHATNLLAKEGRRAQRTYATGALAIARWRWPLSAQRSGVYAEAGIGLQLVDRPSHDVNNLLNSTPMVGFGGTFRFGSRGEELFLGLRLLHISNAGLVPPNIGQNDLFFTLMVRY